MKELMKLLIIIGFALGVFSKKRPNIVFILTDDQDTEMGGLSEMPKLRSLMGDKGATFVNSFVASPLCCPSRSSIFTGQYVHNHGVVNNTVSGGCGSINWQKGQELDTFPVLMNKAGYTTFHAGKYLNTYGRDELGGLAHIPPGWDSWIALKGNSVFYNYSLSVNGIPVDHGNDSSKDYFTNVIKNESVNFIERYSGDKPFFMMLSTPAPHGPYTPEPKYENSLNSSSIPKHPNFNIVNVNKNWFVQLGEQPLKSNVIDTLEDIYRNRLRTLLTVDDMVESVIQALESGGLLDNTYIFYTSDNGFHLGQFSLPANKREPYEIDIRVPLLVRGPGISEGIEIKDAITNIDLAPTFLNIAGIHTPRKMDGRSFKDLLISPRSHFPPLERDILIEFTGMGVDTLHPSCEYLGTGLLFCLPQYDCKCLDAKNNTWSCVRTFGHENNELYCVWPEYDHFEEYYDIAKDPYEITNSINNLRSDQHNYLSYKLDCLRNCSGLNCDFRI